jgi:hypothetical protein
MQPLLEGKTIESSFVAVVLLIQLSRLLNLTWKFDRKRMALKPCPNPDLNLKREMESLLCGASIRRWRPHTPSLSERTALKDFAASTDIAAACDLNLPLRALSIIHVNARTRCRLLGGGSC